MSLVILCSGQGGQHPAMFALTADAPEAASVFAAAMMALGGRDPRAIVVQEDAATMHANRIGQVLCCTQALAAHAALGGALGRDVTYAGYSVGEVAAWGCAGLLEAGAVLALTRERARLMDESSGPNDGLAFARGLPRAAVDDLCERFEAAIAIVTPGLGFVVGGEGQRLDDFCAAAMLGGASRSGRLDVRVAAHTARLAGATPRFLEAIRAARPARGVRAGARLLSGIDGETVFDSGAGAAKLAAQISRTVQWAACLDSCMEAGVTAMLELGPGRALAEMAARSCPGVEARGIEEFRSLDGVRSWLAHVVDQ